MTGAAQARVAAPVTSLPEKSTGVALEVATGVYLLRMPLPFRLDHINLYALDDPSGWTLIDCGLNNPETISRWESLFDVFLGGKPVVRIIVTHLHPDHLGLAHWLQQRTGAPVYMTAEEHEMARQVFDLPITEPSRVRAHYQRLGLTAEALDSMARQAGCYRKLVKTLPDAVTYLCGGEEMSIGGRRWRIVLGRGHSPRCVCLWNDDDGMLIAGDHVLPAISPNVNLLSVGPTSPLEDYLVSLDEFGRYPCRHLLPAHGAPITHFCQRVADIRDHHEAHLCRLEAFCTEPRTASDCVPILFGEGLPDHQLYFAIGEAAAHLVYLADQGRVGRAGEAVWTFLRT